jgi:hypothetical protein
MSDEEEEVQHIKKNHSKKPKKPKHPFLELVMRRSAVQIGGLKALTIKKEARGGKNKTEFFKSLTKEQKNEISVLAFQYLIKNMLEERDDEQIRAMYEYVEDVVDDNDDFFDMKPRKKRKMDWDEDFDEDEDEDDEEEEEDYDDDEVELIEE